MIVVLSQHNSSTILPVRSSVHGAPYPDIEKHPFQEAFHPHVSDIADERLNGESFTAVAYEFRKELARIAITERRETSEKKSLPPVE